MGGLPMGIAMVVDLAHEAVSVPAEKWQRSHGIARAIDNDDCVLSQELRIANTAPTWRSLYWAATAARILVQWTTGDRHPPHLEPRTAATVQSHRHLLTSKSQQPNLWVHGLVCRSLSQTL